MAKVVSSHISARPSCILQRVMGLVSPKDRRSRAIQDPSAEGEYNYREGWCAGRYNFTHGIVFLSYTNIFSQNRPRLENCSLEHNLP